MREQRWPLYKGPVKVAKRRNRLYPKRLGRHGVQYEAKHKGSDGSYRLFMGHYEPRHKKRDYRYAKDGTIRKVLPRAAVSKQSDQSITQHKRRVRKDSLHHPPPRAMLLHLYNDRFEEQFSLEEHRATREPLTWTKRFRRFNYFREACMLEAVLMIIGFTLQIQDTVSWHVIGTWITAIVVLLFPLTAAAALIHHVKKDWK